MLRGYNESDIRDLYRQIQSYKKTIEEYQQKDVSEKYEALKKEVQELKKEVAKYRLQYLALKDENDLLRQK